MTVLAAIRAEICQVEMFDREAVEVVVTAGALRGSVVAVELDPGLAVLHEALLRDVGRTRDTARGMRLLVHPDDWDAVLRDSAAVIERVAGPATAIWFVLGLPVFRGV